MDEKTIDESLHQIKTSIFMQTTRINKRESANYVRVYMIQF